MVSSGRIYSYGVASTSRLLKITGLFSRISSLLQGSFTRETYNFKEPTNRSHPTVDASAQCRYPLKSARIYLSAGESSHEWKDPVKKDESTVKEFTQEWKNPLTHVGVPGNERV